MLRCYVFSGSAAYRDLVSAVPLSQIVHAAVDFMGGSAAAILSGSAAAILNGSAATRS